MLKTIGSKAAEIRVSRAARDGLFAIYESIRENSKLMDAVPQKTGRMSTFCLDRNLRFPREILFLPRKWEPLIHNHTPD